MTKRLLLFLCTAAAFSACSNSSKPMPSSELYLTERMATVLLQQGNAAEAEVAFKKALAQDPENPEMRNGYGLSLLMLGQAHDALQQFDMALKISPNRGSYLNNQGAARVEVGDYVGAEQDFLKAYDSPILADKESALINLGRLRYRQGLF